MKLILPSPPPTSVFVFPVVGLSTQQIDFTPLPNFSRLYPARVGQIVSGSLKVCKEWADMYHTNACDTHSVSTACE